MTDIKQFNLTVVIDDNGNSTINKAGNMTLEEVAMALILLARDEGSKIVKEEPTKKD